MMMQSSSAAESGLSMKIIGLPNENNSDCRNDVSSRGASTTASTRGALGKSSFIINQPITPKTRATVTVKKLCVLA